MPRVPYHLDAIVSVLDDNGEMRAGALADAVGISDATLLSAVKPGLRDGTLVKRLDGRAAYYRLGENAKKREPEAFRAVIHHNGVDLFGLQRVAGGSRLTLAMLQQLTQQAEALA